MKNFISFVALLAASLSLYANPRIAVVDFDANQYAGQLSGAQLADYVTDELVNTNDFDVIEREKIASAMREIGFGQSGAVDPSSAAQFGRVTGVQYLLTGRIISLERNQRSYSGYGVNTVSDNYVLSVSIRIIETETGRIMFSTRTSTTKNINQMGGSRSAVSNPYAGLTEQAAVDMVQAISRSGRFSSSSQASASTGSTDSPRAEPKMVGVTFISVPKGADVEIDGVMYGNTGGEIRVPAGLRRVRITLGGYIPWEKQIMLSAGSSFTANLEQKPKPADVLLVPVR